MTAGQANLALGREELGMRMLRLAREKGNDSVLSVATWGHISAQRGHLDEARKSLEQLLALQKKEYVPRAYLVSIYHDLGDVASAQACLKGALRRRDAELIFMAVMPGYAPFRSHPRLADLISVLGLPAKDTY